MIGTGDKYLGQVRVSSIEKAGFEDTLFAHRYVEIPSNQKMRVLYNADGTADIDGFAPKGLSEGDTGWLLRKYTYDASSRMTERNIAYGAWSLASTYTFE